MPSLVEFITTRCINNRRNMERDHKHRTCAVCGKMAHADSHELWWINLPPTCNHYIGSDCLISMIKQGTNRCPNHGTVWFEHAPLDIDLQKDIRTIKEMLERVVEVIDGGDVEQAKVQVNMYIQNLKFALGEWELGIWMR
jgi:hypothetical protein